MDNINRLQSSSPTWQAPRTSSPSEHNPAFPTEEQEAGESTDRFDPSSNFKLLNGDGEKMGLIGGNRMDGCLSTMMEGGNNPWCPGDHCGLDGSRWPPY